MTTKIGMKIFIQANFSEFIAKSADFKVENYLNPA